MRNPILIAIILGVFLLQACGLQNQAVLESMTEEEAVNTLMDIPVQPGRNIKGKMSQLSATELSEILKDMVESGKVQLDNTRGAINGTVDLSMLTQIFELLQSGKVKSLLGLANGLVVNNGGNSNKVTQILQFILELLNTAMPIVISLFPQYAPIVQALIVIIPVVISIIGLFGNMFKKKSASNFGPLLGRAFA